MDEDRGAATVPRCAACGAANSGGSRFCTACGATLAAGEPAAESRAARAERVLAQRAVAEARQRLTWIRWFLAFAAAGFAVQAAVPGAFVPDAELHQLASIALGLSAAVLLLGVFAIHRQPFAWTLGLAGFLTLLVLVSLLTGGMPILLGVVALGFWGVLPLMAKVSRLLRERPELVTPEQLKRRVGRQVGESATRRQATARRRREGGRRLRTAGLVVGIAAAVAVLGFVVFGLLTRSATIESRIDAFVTAFEAGRFEVVESMCSREQRRGAWPKVARVLEREGWYPAGAALGEPRIVRRSDSWAEVHFALPRGELKTAWTRASSLWQVDAIRLAGVRSR